MCHWFGGYSRYDIAFAYAWYAMHWCPVRRDIQRRVNSLRVQFGAGARFEREEENVKRAYGAIVRKHEWRYIAYERLRRKSRQRLPMWPGTDVRGGIAAWLRGVGVSDAALEAVCP